MVSLCGRGFDSLHLHWRFDEDILTLVRVLLVASLCKSGKAERDSLHLHSKKLKPADFQRASCFSPP